MTSRATWPITHIDITQAAHNIKVEIARCASIIGASIAMTTSRTVIKPSGRITETSDGRRITCSTTSGPTAKARRKVTIHVTVMGQPIKPGFNTPRGSNRARSPALIAASGAGSGWNIPRLLRVSALERTKVAWP